MALVSLSLVKEKSKVFWQYCRANEITTALNNVNSNRLLAVTGRTSSAYTNDPYGRSCSVPGPDRNVPHQLQSSDPFLRLNLRFRSKFCYSSRTTTKIFCLTCLIEPSYFWCRGGNNSCVGRDEALRKVILLFHHKPYSNILYYFETK